MAGTCKLHRPRVSIEPRGSNHAADRLRAMLNPATLVPLRDVEAHAEFFCCFFCAASMSKDKKKLSKPPSAGPSSIPSPPWNTIFAVLVGLAAFAVMTQAPQLAGLLVRANTTATAATADEAPPRKPPAKAKAKPKTEPPKAKPKPAEPEEEDSNENCPTWASNGECTANPGYMAHDFLHASAM